MNKPAPSPTMARTILPPLIPRVRSPRPHPVRNLFLRGEKLMIPNLLNLLAELRDSLKTRSETLVCLRSRLLSVRICSAWLIISRRERKCRGPGRRAGAPDRASALRVCSSRGPLISVATRVHPVVLGRPGVASNLFTPGVGLGEQVIGELAGVHVFGRGRILGNGQGCLPQAKGLVQPLQPCLSGRCDPVGEFTGLARDREPRLKAFLSSRRR